MLIYNEQIIFKIIETFNLKLSVENVTTIKDIINNTDFDTIEEWTTLVNYLKDRAGRDIYNKPIKKTKRNQHNSADWTFYLQEYRTYVTEILGKKGLQRKKYLFPKDVYDITYKYTNERNLCFLKYLQQNTNSIGFKIQENCWGEDF